MVTSFSVAQDLPSSLMPPLANSGNVLEWEWACEEMGAVVFAAAACFDGGRSESVCCSVCSSCSSSWLEHWPSDARCNDAIISSRRPLGMGALGNQQREREKLVP